MKRKIYIAEDDESILEAVKIILEESGCEVREAMDLKQVLEEIESYNPDTVLLDMLLPGASGIAICKSLKKNEKTKNIKVVVTSAHPSGEGIVLKSGADAFLPKPFRASELLEVIK